MCGIYGMVSLGAAPLRHPERLDGMARSLRHRGPDATGRLTEERAALGAERLRIVDDNPEADQPFRDRTTRRTLVCNGEIYNADRMRRQYVNYPYRSLHNDVEPILPLLAARGVTGLSDLVGMFAIAAWSESDGAITLARDRTGEKPLFYLVDSGEVWFASEVQALLCHPSAARTIDRDAVVDYLSLGYVREPRTLLTSIRRVPAGTALVFDPGSVEGRLIRFEPWPAPDRPAGSTDARYLHDLLDEAVTGQLRADVPVGALVSGGLDSSTVAALAAKHYEHNGNRLHTFAVGFDQPSFDEAAPARRLAAAVGATHHEITADFASLRSALTTVVSRVAEPIADPAVLPTYLVCAAARPSVGVLLSGEGADELFGGYPTYLGHAVAPLFGAIPEGLRTALTGVARRISATPRKVSVGFLVDRFARHAAEPFPDRHVAWFGTGWWPWLPAATRRAVVDALPQALPGDDDVAAAMALDFETYLREGLLVKLDRAAMLSSMETRTPFLDPTVVAYARSLPRERKVSRLGTKLILREASRPVVPAWVRRRRKRGLSVPVAGWINAGLRQEVDRLLAAPRLAWSDLLSELPIPRLLHEHRRGVANHARALWPVVILQYWFEHWFPGEVR